MSTSFHRSRSFSKGFTLIELLVVMSIMFTISGLLLARQSRFDSATLLRSLAYSVALSVRQAQIYGSSVVGTTTAASCAGGYTSGGICFASGYGVHLTSGSSGSYTLFADTDGNGRYTAGEDVKAFQLGNGYSISRVSVTTISGGLVRFWPSGGLGTLDIMFRRPNPDACFSSDIAGDGGPTACSSGGSQVYSKAAIQIQSAADTANTRNICIYRTGQIVVATSTTPCI